LSVRRRIVAFVRLARPPFLIGGFAGFALGAAVARFDGHALDVAAYAWGQLLVTSFHLMVHFANDYYDQETDALTARTRWSGGSGVLPAGDLPPPVALTAALVCAASGVVATAHAAFGGAGVVAALGVAIAVLSWFYSAPPARLLARGLGELDTIVVVALLVPLTGYASFAHALGAHAFLATLPGACAMFAMMLCVEIPDARADAATRKRNLVVRWGVASAAIAARTFAAGAVLVLLLIGSAVFGAPAWALLAALPPAAVALAFAVPRDVAHARVARLPFLGVALYALTTCAALTVVAFSSSAMR
jgi:1,4-dihydroxy-2-naphthoate octaprenyltransferase